MTEDRSIVSLTIYKSNPSQAQLKNIIIRQYEPINFAVEPFQPFFVSCFIQLNFDLSNSTQLQLNYRIIFLKNGILEQMESFFSVLLNDPILKLIPVATTEPLRLASRLLASIDITAPPIQINSSYKLGGVTASNKKIVIRGETCFFSIRNSDQIINSMIGKAFNEFKTKYIPAKTSDEIDEANYLINDSAIIFEVSSKKHGPDGTIEYFTFLYDRRVTNFELIDVY